MFINNTPNFGPIASVLVHFSNVFKSKWVKKKNTILVSIIIFTLLLTYNWYFGLVLTCADQLDTGPMVNMVNTINAPSSDLGTALPDIASKESNLQPDTLNTTVNVVHRKKPALNYGFVWDLNYSKLIYTASKFAANQFKGWFTLFILVNYLTLLYINAAHRDTLTNWHNTTQHVLVQKGLTLLLKIQSTDKTNITFCIFMAYFVILVGLYSSIFHPFA